MTKERLLDPEEGIVLRQGQLSLGYSHSPRPHSPASKPEQWPPLLQGGVRRETSLTYKGESKRDALSILLRSAKARPRRACTSSRLKDEAMWLCAAAHACLCSAACLLTWKRICAFCHMIHLVPGTAPRAASSAAGVSAGSAGIAARCWHSTAVSRNKLENIEAGIRPQHIQRAVQRARCCMPGTAGAQAAELLRGKRDRASAHNP